MEGTWGLGGVVGGLGLFLLGLWLATEGLKMAAGGVLYANLAEWTRNRWRSFETGFAISILLPSWGGLTRAAIGLVNSEEVSLRHALWVVVGCGFGAVMTAWVVVGIGFSPFLLPAALVILVAGLILRWSGPGERRGSWGLVLTGTGVLFLGLRILGGTAAALTERIDAFAADPLVKVLVCVVIGAGLAAAMMSTSAVVILVLVAAAAGAIDLTTAAALLVGANFGAVAASMRTLLDGTPDARRVAFGHVVFHAVGSAFGLVVLLITLPSVRAYGSPEGSSLLLLAAFQTTFCVVGAVFLRLADEHLLRWLGPRFAPTGNHGAVSKRLDLTSISVPVLALENVTAEVRRLGAGTLHTARRIFESKPPTEYRTQQDVSMILSLARELDEYTVHLFRAPLPRRIANALLETTRAVHAYRAMATDLVAVRERVTTARERIDPSWMKRIRQYQNPVLQFLESCSPTRADFDADALRNEYVLVSDLLVDLQRRLQGPGTAQAGTRQVLDVTRERLDLLSHLARQASEAAEILRNVDRIAEDGLDVPSTEDVVAAPEQLAANPA